MNLMKKKICFVVSSPFTAKAFLVNHIKALAVFYDVYLIANFENVNLDIFKGLPITEIKNVAIPRDISLGKDFKVLLSLKSYFKEMEFDAIHTVTPKAGLLGIFAARLGCVKTRIHIFTGQVWHTKKGFFKQLLMVLDRFVVWNATHILVDGESQRQFLIQNNIVKDSNSFVLGRGSISGVDISRFFPNEDEKKSVRKELGISDSDVVYMFLGRMNVDKGIRELAQAFEKLNSQYSNLKLLLVGDDEGNMTEYIKKTITSLDKVIFYGSTPSPEKLLQACDVFCLPSYREGFGTSVIEASLMEKPVICSDTYGLAETIVENITGLRHKVADVESLYIQMEKLVEGAELRSKLGIGGRAYVLENFSAKQITEQWLEFYKKNV
jgi:glycosyltransferase involved in cell wall biosynthesis